MRYEKRSNKNGTSYYSFVFANRKRMSREEIRNRFGKDITSEKEAKECLKLLQAKDELVKTRILKRLEWEKEFYNFNSLLEKYLVKQRKKAPNSWENNAFYMKHYVLHYFLQILKLNNIELWSDHYEQFTDWLLTAKTVNEKRVIAYASKNHAIKSLNTFMEYLLSEKLISTYVKCPSFGEHLTNKRTIDDVINPDEMEKVYKKLNELGYKTEALLYRYLFFTGMRFNEALAISVQDLYDGVIDSEFFQKKMKAYSIKYFGYIVADSQYGGLNNNGELIKLPFKGKKAIEERYNRTIPVVDKVLWNALIDSVEGLIEKKGKKRKDMLLFEGIDDTTSTTRLRIAYDQCSLKYRSWHCLRHSRATLLIGETADVMLARIWLGHSSPRTIEKYNHIYQALTRAAKSKLLKDTEHGLKRAK